MGSERLPVRRRPSVCSVSYLVFGRLFASHSFVLTLLRRSFSCYCLCRGHPSLLKRPLKFRNVLKYSDMSESRSSLSSKHQRIPTALKVFLGFENDKNRSSTKTFTQRTWKSTEEVQCQKITLDELGPIWGIHFFTLTIS